MRSKYYQVAFLHSNSITTGFLSLLGTPFLSTLYKAIDRCPYSVLVLVMDDDLATGFITGTVSVKKMYRWIVLRYGVVFVFQLLPKAFDISFLSRIIETLFYTMKKKHVNNEVHSVCEAELLSVAVGESGRGKGVGSRLVGELEQYFTLKGITRYKVVTYAEDALSNAFYIKNAFVLTHQFEHHGNVLNEYEKGMSTWQS